jgi:mRNA deadenylase 3'-5' endonuclease subunit Ccr4
MMLKYQENRNRLVKLTSVYQPEDLPYTNVTADFKGTIDYMFYE